MELCVSVVRAEGEGLSRVCVGVVRMGDGGEGENEGRGEEDGEKHVGGDDGKRKGKQPEGFHL